MGLLLICPHCQAKIPLLSRTCPVCGGDLRDLPSRDRRYFIGSWTPAAAASPASEILADLPPETPEAEEWAAPYPETMEFETSVPESKDVSLCEALDRILNKGAVLFGEVIISVADIDLVYLGLQVILSSMETARGDTSREEGPWSPNLSIRGACK